MKKQKQMLSASINDADNEQEEDQQEIQEKIPKILEQDDLLNKKRDREQVPSEIKVKKSKFETNNNDQKTIINNTGNTITNNNNLINNNLVFSPVILPPNNMGNFNMTGFYNNSLQNQNQRMYQGYYPSSYPGQHGVNNNQCKINFI